MVCRGAAVTERLAEGKLKVLLLHNDADRGRYLCVSVAHVG